MDSYFTAGRSARSAKDKDKAGAGRLAHRACNTKKVATIPVINWPDRLFVSDPAAAGSALKRSRVAALKCRK
jgi:hypothetical protein